MRQNSAGVRLAYWTRVPSILVSHEMASRFSFTFRAATAATADLSTVCRSGASPDWSHDTMEEPAIAGSVPERKELT